MTNQNNNSEKTINLNSFLEFCNHLNEIIIITDNKDLIVFTNEAFKKHFGFSEQQIKDKNIDNLFLNKQIDISDGKICTATMVDKNGVEFKCELKSVTHTSNENLEYKFFFVNDLREKIEQKRELKEYEDRFQTLFLEIKDAIYESTPDGTLVDMNPSGVELFGYSSKEEMLKANIAEELYLNPYDRTKFKNQLEREGYVKDYEIGVRRKDGTIATVLETAFTVKDAEGKIKSYRGILRDITAAKNYEAKLRKYINELGQVNKQLIKSEEELKNLNAAKDKFFSILAHDLRSPFTSLIGYSEFLIDDIEELSKEEIKSFAGNINESAQVVFNLLENLLQWSRVQTGRIKIDPEIYDISQLADSTINLLKNNALKKSIKVINNIPQRTLVYSDVQTISSVMQNLLSNAIKFTPKEGKIELGCITAHEKIDLFVADTGVGIKEEDKAKLFRMDQHLTTAGTEKEEGSGLGLILCKELVEKNKGSIWVESELGKGSTFYFRLPTQG
ncbi:MAG: PAS domain-containing sensor histidine kinase [Melioribacteraceae bacterium]|nr:PAS domain-containing sensor histidine kinase [Melioribacteraceae bacterium]